MTIPPTERLDYTDPYLSRFEARVVARSDHGGRPAVALDRTAFYPGGGGQPADQGTLSQVRVLDIQVVGAVVWHALESPLAADTVTGQVDWARRFDHMQQHHGQHLLSAAFEELFGLPTLAFHLGVEYSSIDLPGDVSEAQIRSAESRANEVIWEDRPVEARFVAREELARIPLRKPPVVEGPIRVVSVSGFDHSACGGTHPRSTGAVGLLHARRRERRGAETRVEFLCGGRALADLQKKTTILARLMTELSVGLDEVEDAVRRVKDHEAASRKRLETATERLLEHEARALVAAAESGTEVPLVTMVRDDLDVAQARRLATAIAAAGAFAVLGIRGEKSHILLSRPAGSGVDCGQVVREVLTPLGGRGGGQPALAQGGVPDSALLEEALARAASALYGT
jgi:alanyl-tRNA synthetase